MSRQEKTILIVIGICLLGFFILYFLTTIKDSRERIKIKQTKILLAYVESVLERYQMAQGNYPIHNGQAQQGGAILYDVLSEWDPDLKWPSGAIEEINGQTTIVDGWGNPFHYQCQAPNTPPKDRTTMNPTYDLWSTGGQKGDSQEERTKWISNWRSN